MSFSLAKDSDGKNSTSAAFRQFVKVATNAGIHIAVAAGNDNGADACNSTPAFLGGSNGEVVAVGSMSMENTVSSFSNTGSCVDVYAPGEQIMSAWIGAPNMVNMDDGTSMSTPHVAGIMAYLIAQNQTLAQNPAAMKQYLRDTAFQGQLSGTVIQGDPLLVVNNGMH